MPRRRAIHRRPLLVGLAALAALAIALGLALVALTDEESPPAPAPAPPAAQRADVLPRGDTPAESARLLAEWLRARAR